MMTMTALLFLVVAQTGIGSAYPPQVTGDSFSPERHRPETSGVQGTIRGRVILPGAQPRRRVADRYAGGGAAAAHRIQDIPAVAFLQGAIPGHPFPRPASDPTMAQEDTAFVPSLLVVPPGTSVSFPNMDPFFHNVFSYSSTERFDLGRYPQGEAKEVVFDEPGIVKVYCEVHEHMRSAILVLENPFYAVVGEDGAFELTGVPPGDYVLMVWHADHGMEETPVTVTEGGTVEVTVELS
jgi:hypothetical protein